ncbi:hypothetical protein E2C01_095206 [Portunus trituberculatus]|uniref:Immunoglobulin I-set domain-containing protein n=1 Tax=Portunus trituberculatus TaxID=210409 RepID=A0A5B7JSH8_PORTR|nr:hypothetical protein [Portunus trituberculatus]
MPPPQTGLVTWASTFIIKSVREQDYGDYVCVAENELGASTTQVRFTRPTRPDPPLALKVCAAPAFLTVPSGLVKKKKNVLLLITCL